MSDLISRAAAIDAVYYKPSYKMAIEVLKEVPAVDAAPVVHGRWIEYPLCLGYVGAYSEDHIVCSNCKSVWSIIDNDTERFKHCPNCGAKMDADT